MPVESEFRTSRRPEGILDDILDPARAPDNLSYGTMEVVSADVHRLSRIREMRPWFSVPVIAAMLSALRATVAPGMVYLSCRGSFSLGKDTPIIPWLAGMLPQLAGMFSFWFFAELVDVFALRLEERRFIIAYHRGDWRPVSATVATRAVPDHYR